MEILSTDQLVAQLKRLGLKASPESLLMDVHRGLLSPLMPSTETPGRGVSAQWSPMSVRRARRMARLRKRGVNGHVLPLLLFLEDGWGWEKILPDLQAAVEKSWMLDRAYLNKPTRVRTHQDLLDNAQETEARVGHPDHAAIKDLRAWLYGHSWYGEPLGDASPLAFMTDTLPTLLGEEVSVSNAAEMVSRAEDYIERREALHLPTNQVAGWLAILDAESVERGRTMFWMTLRVIRQHGRRSGLPGNNPLTLGGVSPSQIAAYFRSSTGRLTPAQVLGACISQAMMMALIAGDMGQASIDESS
jgi:hypothetical protein